MAAYRVAQNTVQQKEEEQEIFRKRRAVDETEWTSDDSDGNETIEKIQKEADRICQILTGEQESEPMEESSRDTEARENNDPY